MTVRYKIDPDTDVIYVGLTGVVRDAEIQYTVEIVLPDLDQRDEINSVMDLRAIERFEVSDQAVQQAVEAVGKHLEGEGHSWKAAVIAPTGTVPGVMRMNRLLRQAPTEQVGIFLKMSAARKWLGLSPEETNV